MKRRQALLRSNLPRNRRTNGEASLVFGSGRSLFDDSLFPCLENLLPGRQHRAADVFTGACQLKTPFVERIRIIDTQTSWNWLPQLQWMTSSGPGHRPSTPFGVGATVSGQIHSRRSRFHRNRCVTDGWQWYAAFSRSGQATFFFANLLREHPRFFRHTPHMPF